MPGLMTTVLAEHTYDPVSKPLHINMATVGINQGM